MKREIKFRAWDGEKMHYYEWEKFVIQFNGTVGLFDGKVYSPVQWELMQYTGIKDMDNKDIYEDDIIRFAGPVGNEVVMRVIFKFGSFCKSNGKIPTPLRSLTTLTEYEVLGNIYEHPELAKEHGLLFT